MSRLGSCLPPDPPPVNDPASNRFLSAAGAEGADVNARVPRRGSGTLLVMETAQAHAFARHWLESWNDARPRGRSRSLRRGRRRSRRRWPPSLVEGSGGVVHGKDQLRAYWEAGLERNPDLHFDLVDLYVGVDTVVINYRNERGGLVVRGAVVRRGTGGRGPRHLPRRSRPRCLTVTVPTRARPPQSRTEQGRSDPWLSRTGPVPPTRASGISRCSTPVRSGWVTRC